MQGEIVNCDYLLQVEGCSEHGNDTSYSKRSGISWLTEQLSASHILVFHAFHDLSNNLSSQISCDAQLYCFCCEVGNPRWKAKDLHWILKLRVTLRSKQVITLFSACFFDKLMFLNESLDWVCTVVSTEQDITPCRFS